MSNITLIAAMDFHRGIGFKNQLPWNLPEDLTRFKSITMGHPIVMGRKTFESIGRTLPGRHNIVFTRDPTWSHSGVSRLLDVDEAVNGFLKNVGEVFVIGGAEIYKAFLPHANRLLLTRIFKAFECDTFFPAFSEKEWLEYSRITHCSRKNAFDYSYIEYRRIE